MLEAKASIGRYMRFIKESAARIPRIRLACIQSRLVPRHGCLRLWRSMEGLLASCNGCRAEIWALGSALRLAPGCASMRRNAPSPGSAALHGWICLHEGRLAAGRSALPARASRPGQAPGDPLPWPGAERHVLDDHRQPSPCPAHPAGIRGLRLRHPRPRARTPGSGRHDRINRSSARRPSARRGSRAGTSTTWSATTCPRSSITWSGTRAMSGSTGSATAWAA